MNQSFSRIPVATLNTIIRVDRSRWSYDFAFNVIKDIPVDKAVVMTWGERLMLPGTVLAKDAVKKH